MFGDVTSNWPDVITIYVCEGIASDVFSMGAHSWYNRKKCFQTRNCHEVKETLKGSDTTWIVSLRLGPQEMTHGLKTKISYSVCTISQFNI